MNQKRILFIFAHPDDESFTSGVTIAKYARENLSHISLLCATRGQAGKAGDPPLCSDAELPLFREKELREAASILGINQVDVLDYKDKHLSAVPIDELKQHVTSSIQRYQPQIVVTFAPHGISGHPDHKAISEVTREAVKELSLTTTSVKKLYLCTVPTTKSFTSQTGVPLYSDPYEAITTEISAPEYLELAAKALLAHKTQHLSVERVFPGISAGNYSNVRSTNYFILAWHNLPQYSWSGKEQDFFSGIL